MKTIEARGRTWTVSIVDRAADDDLMPWLEMTPDERVELVGDCVMDGLRVKGKRDVPRFRRVLRITQRPSR